MTSRLPKNVDVQRLVANAQHLFQEMQVEAAPEADVRIEIERILNERDLIALVDNLLISKREAAQNVLAHLQSWILGSRSYAEVPELDYTKLEEETEAAIFGPRSREPRTHTPSDVELTPSLEKLLIRPTSDPQTNSGFSDLGFLVEAAALYREITVFADRGVLRSFLHPTTLPLLTELLEQGHLRVVYQPDFLLVQTHDDKRGRLQHDVCAAEIQDSDLPSVVESALIGASGRRGMARRVATRLDKLITTQRWGNEVSRTSRALIQDEAFARKVAGLVLDHFVPSYEKPRDLVFRLSPSIRGYEVETNIDFGQANSIYHAHTSPTHSTLTVAWILAQYHAAIGDLHLMQQASGGAIATAPLYAKLLELIVTAAADVATQPFHTFRFSSAKDLREAINSNTLSGNEILELLRSARSLRDSYTSMRSVNDETTEFMTRLFTSVPQGLRSKALEWEVASTTSAEFSPSLRTLAEMASIPMGDHFLAPPIGRP